MFDTTASMDFNLKIVDCRPLLTWLSENTPFQISLHDSKNITFDSSTYGPTECSGYTIEILDDDGAGFVNFQDGNDYFEVAPVA